ncbi:hypothetical protein GCM10009118_07920 [Wandonia haliotis]|uniref:Uncharacterized protein n=1 Tax=Wandonia haliotis TaxID=574963 RepID=A0ABN1MME8_9FLAO
MKYLIFTAWLFIVIPVTAQLTYVDIDWQIDQTVIMQDGVTDSIEIDIDEDGVNDLRITSWSNHTTGIETAIEALLLSSSLYEGFDVDGCNSLRACFEGGGSNSSINGYIYSSDCSNPSNDYIKFPFQFDGEQGIHCGFLYVQYEGSIITIEGYAWNSTPSGTCSCNSSGWLGIKEELLPEGPYRLYNLLGQEIFEPEGPYRLYNLLGQEIFEPEGLTLKVYRNGLIQKIYTNQ